MKLSNKVCPWCKSVIDIYTDEPQMADRRLKAMLATTVCCNNVVEITPGVYFKNDIIITKWLGPHEEVVCTK